MVSRYYSEGLQAQDLKFWKEVEGGKKTQYIFRQEDTFYVLTTMDANRRGNFYAIHEAEVESVRKQLAEYKDIPDVFYCPNIFSFISNIGIPLPMHRGQTIDKKLIAYYVDRLTRICYILVAQGKLRKEKAGRRMYFRKCHKTLNQPLEEQTGYRNLYEPDQNKIKRKEVINQVPKSGGNTHVNQSNPPATIMEKCPYCRAQVLLKKFEKHKREKCPKRPGHSK